MLLLSASSLMVIFSILSAPLTSLVTAVTSCSQIFICKKDYVTNCVLEMMMPSGLEGSKVLLYHIFIYFIGKRKREKSVTKFTGVPCLLLEHGGPMFTALHHEADLSLHLTMKV